MLSKLLTQSLSPASIRNVMSDLEALGLIYAPHVSGPGGFRRNLDYASSSTHFSK